MQKIYGVSWIILITSISFTVLISLAFSYTLFQSEHQSFQSDADLMTLLIHDELDQYEQVLIGAEGLFAASDDVTLSEWRSFVEIQDIKTRFPGLQGVAYVEHTLHEDRTKLITEMKSYGSDDFDITPPGDRDEYYPVLFLEPLNLRNQKAIGYDIYFEQTRKNTINILKETGDTTITEKITLVQEIDDDVQNGFLMLVPVYSNTHPHGLQGIVDTVIRINDFIQGTVDSKSFEHLRLKIYDGTISEENLFFNSDEISTYEFESPDFSTTVTTSLYNKNWIFVYDGIQSPQEQIDLIILFAIPIVGFFMSFLLFYLFRIIAKNSKLNQDAINREKIATMGTMASRMSHDLKNPLTVIKSCLELLKMNLGDKMDEKTQNYVKRIEDSTGLISSIINDVLEFAKTPELHIETISIKTMLETVVSNIDVPKNIQINLPKNEISIKCDAIKMESVFSNLISNSIQSIDDEGLITISVEGDSRNITIFIVDSGSGIPEDKISKVFEPLFTTKSSGTGLGLHICKNIIEQHGGELSVINNPTTFTVILPKNPHLKLPDNSHPSDGLTKLRKILKIMLKDTEDI